MRRLILSLLIQLGLMRPLACEEIVYVQTEYVEPTRKNSVAEDLVEVFGKANWKDFFYGLKNFIAYDIFKDTLWQVIKNLPRNIFRTIFEILKFLKNPISSIKVAWIGLKDAWRTFIEMSWEEKAVVLLKAIAGSMAMYMGYSVPDLDITLMGIGSHRHFATHSIIPALIVMIGYKGIGRFLSYLDTLLPENRNTLWSKIFSFYEETSFIPSAFAAGVGIHLAQDLFIDGSQSIRGPWGGTIIKDTYIDDNAYLAVNAFGSFSKK